MRPNFITAGLEPIITDQTEGGYAAWGLKKIAERIGATGFAVYRNMIPRDEDEAEYVKLRAAKDATCYAYRDDDKMVYVVFHGVPGWMKALNDAGIHAWAIKKLVKRLKTINRPSLAGAEMPEIQVRVVDFDAYTHESEVHNMDSSLQERLLDGIMIVHPRIFRLLCDRMDVEGFQRDEEGNITLRGALQRMRLRSGRVGNIRVVLKRDEWVTINGKTYSFIKGNCIVPREMEFEGIITTISNLKEEVTSDDITFMQWEPQGMIEEERTNVQALINFADDRVPGGNILFPLHEMDTQLTDWFSEQFRKLENGEILEDFGQTESTRWASIRRYGNVQDTIGDLTRWGTIEWRMRGMDYRDSLFLTTQAGKNVHANLIRVKPAGIDPNTGLPRPQTDHGVPRIPVACSRHLQVLSHSAAVMAGYGHIQCPRGYMRFIPQLGVVVKNDLDFIQDFHDHGTPDGDDFYAALQRTITVAGEDEQRYVVWRTPMSRGEYATYKYWPGDEVWSWTNANGEVISFPKVETPLEAWPMRVTEGENRGLITYTGLPSSHEESLPELPTTVPTEYSLLDFINEVDDSVNAGTAGKDINSHMLWWLVLQTFIPETLCPLDDVIDTYVQAGKRLDREALDQEAQDILDAVVEYCIAHNIGVDRAFWESRRFELNLSDNQQRPRLVDGYFTQVLTMVKRKKNEFDARVKRFAQANRSVPALLRIVGQKYVGEANRLQKAYRFQSWQANQEMGYTRTQMPWSQLMQPIMDAFDAKPTDEERANLALSLWLVGLTVPTSGGRYNDQIAMNNAKEYANDGTHGRNRTVVRESVFHWLMLGLRMYGLAADELDIVEDEGNNTYELVRRYQGDPYWPLKCSVCGTVYEVTNPLTVQRFYGAARICKLHR